MDEFETYRPLLFSIAYRMTGSASEAEDLVQEAYLRSRAAPTDTIREPKAYLTTIITRLALDHLKSARVAREQYIGPWLAEPVMTTDGALAPLETVEQRETIEQAVLVLLERLSPPERAVFLLREVFDYGYDQIAEIIGMSQAACRQLFHRAKQRLAERRPRFSASPESQQRLVQQFLAAAQRGDLQTLQQLLAQEVTVWSDGGGKVPSVPRPIVGQVPVSRFLLGLMRRAPADTHFSIAEINGRPGVLIWTGAVLDTVAVFDGDDERIHTIHFVRNPDKLAYLRRQVSTSSPSVEN